MNKQRDSVKHFEAILGRDLVLEDTDAIAVRENVAADTRDEGRLTSREIGTTGSATKACGEAGLLDVGGVARTGQDGTADFMLSEFFCDFSGTGAAIRFSFPATFVATPRSLNAVFVTAMATAANNARDVRIRVATWDPAGSPQPNTSFDFRCRVPYTIVVD